MSAATLTDLESWVSKMMKTLKQTDYKLDISGNSTKGDGYLGEITFVEITTPHQTTNNNYQIVVKSAKQSDELRKQTPVKDAYDREIFFYSKILPLLDEFQRLKSIERPFKNYAKCYYISTDIKKEALLLQNLKTIGYDLHDRKQPMNLNHVLMVIRAYGRFHGVSLAMRDQKPAVFNSLTKNMTDVFAKFFENEGMANSFFKCFQDARELLKKDHPKIYEKYQMPDKQLIDVLLKSSSPDDPTSAILHGDCWNNNFMFKYQDSDTTKPVDMVFLDFQLSKVASVVIDLSYFFYACADQKCLKEFDFILQAYHSSLSDFLTELGSDPEIVFPFKELQKQWKRYGRFGVLMATFLLKISLCDADEAPDFTESCENGTVDNVLNFQIKDQDVYERRVIDVLVHYGERFL